MKQAIACFLWAAMAATVFGADKPKQSIDSYGSAVVSQILRIDEQATLYCNIENFPPLIGKNMPVMLKDLKPANSAEANKKIQAFLSALLMNKAESKPKIQLSNIQRGKTFCLCADIYCDGKDIAEMLIEKGLAQRIIEVKEPKAPDSQTSETSATKTQASKAPPAKSGYVASKTSKVFHRADCYHVRRMNMDKAVTFATREQATKTNRRPCKSCNP